MCTSKQVDFLGNPQFYVFTVQVSISQHDARQGAERRYKRTLEQVGLSEEFVRQKGKDATDLLEEEASDVHR